MPTTELALDLIYRFERYICDSNIGDVYFNNHEHEYANALDDKL